MFTLLFGVAFDGLCVAGEFFHLMSPFVSIVSSPFTDRQ
jgi:hypothetical protein